MIDTSKRPTATPPPATDTSAAASPTKEQEEVASFSSSTSSSWSSSSIYDDESLQFIVSQVRLPSSSIAIKNIDKVIFGKSSADVQLWTIIKSKRDGLK